jgi:hypothetical protein
LDVAKPLAFKSESKVLVGQKRSSVEEEEEEVLSRDIIYKIYKY